MVSVFMLTYNQRHFIAQAIEGVLMQETKFPVILVIGEDCSTDGTREICIDYKKKYPDRIKLLLNNKNVGLGANYIKTLDACDHKYIAICDGDDYWTDPSKLQKQVDFLEKNSNFNIVYTNNLNIYPSGRKEVRDLSGFPKEGFFEDLVFQNYIASVTVMFKNMPLSDSMKRWMKKLPYGDWPTYLWILKNGGKIGLIDEVTAVYRKDFGISTGLRKKRTRIGEINLYILEKLKEEPGFSEKAKIIRRANLKYKTGLIASYNREKKYLAANILFLRCLIKTTPIKLIRLYFYSLKQSFYN